MSDLRIDCLPEKQAAARNLRMVGLGECAFGLLHPEDEEVTEVRLLYAGFREPSGVVLDLYDQIFLLV